jgi:hypothetical protein
MLWLPALLIVLLIAVVIRPRWPIRAGTGRFTPEVS